MWRRGVVYLLVIGKQGWIIQDDDPGGTKFTDAHNGFNDLSRIAMI